MTKYIGIETIHQLNGFTGTVPYLCKVLLLTPQQVKEQLTAQYKEADIAYKKNKRNKKHTLKLPNGTPFEGTAKELAIAAGVPMRDAYRMIQGTPPKKPPRKGNTITIRITYTNAMGKQKHITIGPTPCKPLF